MLVKGWIRTTRDADKKRLLFVELTDGSSVKGVQLVFEGTPLLLLLVLKLMRGCSWRGGRHGGRC